MRAHVSLLLTVGVCAVLSSGCGLFASRTTIVPIGPEQEVISAATISVDGRPVGHGTTQVRYRGSVAVTVDGSPEYLSTSFTLEKGSGRSVQIALRRNELYFATMADENQVINRWITLSIGPDSATDETWWTSIVTALSGAELEVEIMDRASGFIRTAWRESRFGDQEARRRFQGNVVTRDPLQWRLRYEVQVRSGREWIPYDRGFRDDLDALSEIRSRTAQ